MFLTSAEIIEVLNTLPEPVRTLAIHNHVEHYEKGKTFIAEEPHDYLFAAFEWKKTVQGYAYWASVYDWLLEPCGDCPLPIVS